ncbi:MAG TPA: glycosyltransferase family 4 protein [Acidimicrobiales bacterium]|nr:glycosyltransferase family 4 protein [Acidimicrobiales bacterium]
MSRVAFFDGYPHAYAGAQRSTHELAAALLRHGWDAEVVLPEEGVFAARLAADGIPVRVVESPPALRHYGHTTTGVHAVRAAAALPRYWRRVGAALRGRADVVHVNDQRGMVLAGPAARLARIPIVWHVHGVRPPRALNWLGRGLATRTVALTEADATLLSAPRRKHRPDVVANAPAETFFAIERSPAVPPVLLTVGRLSPVKGIDVLMHTVARLRDAGRDVTAVVAGGEQAGYAGYAADLRRLRDSLGLAQTVTLSGHLDDTSGELARASLYVQPARWEGVPLAVLEAMAAGVPVVATDVGGIRDVIAPDVNGLLVPPDDPVAMAEAIAALLDDVDRAARLGAAGRRLTRERYTREGRELQMVGIYRDVLA